MNDIYSIQEDTGLSIEMISDIVSLGSKTFWSVIGSFNTRKTGDTLNSKNSYCKRTSLLYENKIVALLAKELRIKHEVLIVFIQFLNGELDAKQDEDLYDEFFLFFTTSLGIKEELKIQELKPIFTLMLSKDKSSCYKALEEY